MSRPRPSYLVPFCTAPSQHICLIRGYMSSLKSNYAKNIDFFDAPRLNVIPVALKTHTQMHNRTAQNAAVAGKDVLVRTKKRSPTSNRASFSNSIPCHLMFSVRTEHQGLTCTHPFKELINTRTQAIALLAKIICRPAHILCRLCGISNRGRYTLHGR